MIITILNKDGGFIFFKVRKIIIIHYPSHKSIMLSSSRLIETDDQPHVNITCVVSGKTSVLRAIWWPIQASSTPNLDTRRISFKSK